MVLTNEPGCYFIDALLNKAINDSTIVQYINIDILDQYRNFGGVRLEDDILITLDGCENFTLCPRTVNEIEDVMGGGKWPPAIDEAPELKRRWVKLGTNGIGMIDFS